MKKVAPPTMHCRNDLYATPLSWEMEHVTVDHKDEPIEETRLKKQARIVKLWVRP